MRKNLIAAMGVLALWGCQPTTPDLTISQTIPKGRYADYRALIVELTRHYGIVGPEVIPETVQQDFRECMIKIAMSSITPAEMAKLDAYARGEAAMSEQELNSMGDVIEKRASPTDAAIMDSARQTCPDTVNALVSYGNGAQFKTVYVP